MEERIKELAVKAGFCSWDGEIYTRFREDDEEYSLDDELSDFAKLIVEECANIAHNSSACGEDLAKELLYKFDVGNARNMK